MNIDVKKIAKLANIPLTDEEEKKFEAQLLSTLEYIEHLNEVDTKNITPTAHVTGLENVLREDVAKQSLTQDQALSNTKSQHNGLFKVKGIFEDE